ncbi:regulatory associated protein of mTOR [Trypanosoma rangeli]|uniref:Regulatory associated protein of mTOR n=1 Tax=Trypanosoma rangeli TaxID=5698 RepID=A0A3S5IS64_TRYRA|nr:regulatory associated protein of mTOR [Trypanosoma rangeli]RNF10046.1 regulatory associated protein of mTOR [Trypanosoma rangeli]|eukprot:RNF10046.1 regulatory associated protein of mTOR [Trypanosoma rangeli]
MLNRRRAGTVTSNSEFVVVERRLAAFAPHHLPALLAGLKADEGEDVVPAELSLAERPTRPKSKSTQVILLLCLNIGSDPPDYPRIEPCSRLECWIDPHVAQISRFSSEGGADSIAERLERQYRAQQRDATFKRAVDAHLEEAKHLMMTFRRKADNGRVLLHYNGHGMPRATDYGEIWFFDKDRTHYVPMNIVEISRLIDSPTLFVFDCNSAGSILQHWYKQRLHQIRPHDIFFCACSAGSFLPLNPQLPADVLTSCLTTPLQMALEWYINFSHRRHLLPNVTAEMIHNVPGELSERKSPLGELYWILIAVTDTVAWCTTPPAQFYKLFRQDTMTKALFRSFLLADRILREVGCVPVAHPPIASQAHLHHIWDLWEYTLEQVVCQLPELLTSELTVNPSYTYKSSTFFVDQLMAFKVWVESGDLREQPEELPSVLLALTQISYRVQALTLLVRYLDSGVSAGRRAIFCGILPYASKLLVQTPEVFLIVSVLWMQLTRASTREGTEELLQSRLEKYFIRVLQLDEKNTNVVTVGDDETATTSLSDGNCCSSNNATKLLMVFPESGTGPAAVSNGDTKYYLMKELDLHRCKAMACYVLCQWMKCGGEQQYVACWNNQLLNAAFSLLESPNAEVRSWSCLVLAQLFLGLRHAKEFASMECTTRLDLFTYLLQDKSPIVRSSCVTLLASLVGVQVDALSVESQIRRVQMEKSLLIKLRGFIFEASMSVREELIFFACQVLFHYGSLLSTLQSNTSATRYMDYIQEVGKYSPKWMVDELDVQVTSQLNASRPTSNTRFVQAVMFTTEFLSRDDPAPSASGFCRDTIDPKVLKVLCEMVHDAALMLYTLYHTCDTNKVVEAIKALTSQQPPQLHRLENESLRSMSRVVSTDSSHFLSEADRARSTRNADNMRQLVLEMQDRRLEPRADLGNKNRSSKAEDNGTYRGNGAVSTSAITRHQVLPSLISGDQIISATFRALEPNMVLATKNRHIYHTSYETYSTQTRIYGFAVSLLSPLQDVLVINDLSEQAGLLLVTKEGGFSLIKGCWGEGHGVPTEVAAFSACSPRGFVDIKSVYRSYNANLLYGGSIGSNGGTEIHVLSLDEEQVIQRLRVSGDPTLTSLTANTTTRAIFAGCSDGAVRYYDDRQKQGFLGVVGMFNCKGVLSSVSFPTAAASADAVVGAGPVETGAGVLMVAAATRSAVYIYDSRKFTEPSLVVDIFSLCGGHGGWPSVSRSSSILAFATGVHTGLLGALLSDGTYLAMNARGRALLEKPIKVSNTQGPPLPGSCVVHPLRPFMSVGGEIMYMH